MLSLATVCMNQLMCQSVLRCPVQNRRVHWPFSTVAGKWRGGGVGGGGLHREEEA